MTPLILSASEGVLETMRSGCTLLGGGCHVSGWRGLRRLHLNDQDASRGTHSQQMIGHA